jgi:hypothetical protein
MFLTFYSNRVRKPTGDSAHWGRSTGGYRLPGIATAAACPLIWRRGSRGDFGGGSNGPGAWSEEPHGPCRSHPGNWRGWAGEEALAIGVYAALSGTDYLKIMRIATNHDGDSDSTASIAGQLWGAWKGIEGIPHDLVSRRDVLCPLLHAARQAEVYL